MRRLLALLLLVLGVTLSGQSTSAPRRLPPFERAGEKNFTLGLRYGLYIIGESTIPQWPIDMPLLRSPYLTIEFDGRITIPVTDNRLDAMTSFWVWAAHDWQIPNVCNAVHEMQRDVDAGRLQSGSAMSASTRLFKIDRSWSVDIDPRGVVTFTGTLSPEKQYAWRELGAALHLRCWS